MNKIARLGMVACLCGLSLLSFGTERQAAPKWSFGVKVVGHGKPVLLIPGLGCGPAAWATTVQHLKSKYQCHLITLPGFAGQPAIGPPMLLKVKNDIERYVLAKKLHRPLIIGHSLGATMGFWLTSDKPKMFSGFVAVDGLPYLAALYNVKATPASETRVVKGIQQTYQDMSQAELAKGFGPYLEQAITDPADRPAVRAELNRTEPRAFGEALAELMTNDLRPSVSKILCPVLYFMSSATYGNEKALEAAKNAYMAQLQSIKRLTFVVAPKSKHFIMLDAPNLYFTKLDSFLANIR